MTRKHFEAIAAALLRARTKAKDVGPAVDEYDAGYRTGSSIMYAAVLAEITDTLAQFNPNFDRDRFKEAAGL